MQNIMNYKINTFRSVMAKALDRKQVKIVKHLNVQPSLP